MNYVVIRTNDETDSQLAIGPFASKDEALSWIGKRLDGETFSYYVLFLRDKDFAL